MLLIFDVDGTLTPSRGMIDQDFKRWFMDNVMHRSVLVTGSDPDKTRQQIGADLYDMLVVYNCAGNQVVNRGIEVYRSEWRIPDDLEHWLTEYLDRSAYPIRTGQHIEHRVGLCNFSVVGRGAQQPRRDDYYRWDVQNGERIALAKEIMHLWPGIEATVAGETGIDIYPVGKSKAQLAAQLARFAPLHFFGDRMDPAGNDHALAMAISDGGYGQSHPVTCWQDTWKQLEELLATRSDHQW